MDKILVLLKKQSWEKVHGYCLVDQATFDTMDPSIIYKSTPVPNKEYTKEQLEKLRDENV